MALQIQSCHLVNILEVNAHPRPHCPSHGVESVFKASGFLSATYLTQANCRFSSSVDLEARARGLCPLALRWRCSSSSHSHSPQALVSKGRSEEGGGERPSACGPQVGGLINDYRLL